MATMYVCSNCWNSSLLKLGKCSNCQEFGTFVKQAPKLASNKQKKTTTEQIIWAWEVLDAKNLEELKLEEEFYPLEDKELLRVMQNGISVWGIYLLAGNPGAWKSTLMAQITSYMTKNLKVAYFSWEEHEAQVYHRFKRLGLKSCDIYHTWNIEDIFATIDAKWYEFVVIDSIQTAYTVTCEGSAGKSAQVTAVAEMLTQYFKTKKITAFIIGHYTKGGDVAWPKYLEHLVDASLQLDGDKYQMYKFLRASKNRFSQNDSVGIFEMTEKWLQAVTDMKERVLKSFTKRAWNVLGVGIDEGRPCLVNIEVLITKSAYKFPQRNVIGYDKDRVDLIVAILQKYLGISFEEKDIFLNIPWEQSFKKDNGLDLAVAAALYSAATWKIFNEQVFFGEITLMWKIRKPTFANRRMQECEGFEQTTNVDNNKNDITDFFQGKTQELSNMFQQSKKQYSKNIENENEDFELEID